MENKKPLINLNRMELMGHLKTLVKKEKELTLEILDYLQEISNRKVFLEMGYPTLFAFLTEELGYCSGTAYLRIQTMKALEVPENRDRVLKDKTSLNSLAKAQSFINNQNKELSKQSEPLLTEKEKEEFFTAAEGVSANKVEEVLKEKKHEMEVKKSTEQGLPPPVKKIMKKFNFEADQELVGMIEEIKSLFSHTCPGGELAEVLKKALPLAIQEIKIKKGLVKRSETRQVGMSKDRGDIKTSQNDLNFQREKKERTSVSPEDLHPQNEKSEKIKAAQDHLKHQNARSQESFKVDGINSNNIDSIKPDDGISSMKSRCVEFQREAIQNFHHLDGNSYQKLKMYESQVVKEGSVSQGQNTKVRVQKRKVTRAISLELKRKVWKRDGGCCQYKDLMTGKRCGSKYI